jgi:hypothetical protein
MAPFNSLKVTLYSSSPQIRTSGFGVDALHETVERWRGCGLNPQRRLLRLAGAGAGGTSQQAGANPWL